jgi:hypothetical protein
MEDEVFFKRFPLDQQEQIRSLVNYSILMGLSGKDLISIGNRLERIKRNQDLVHTQKLLSEMKPYRVGGEIYTRFNLKTNTDTYRFKRANDYYYDYQWSITNVKTKAEMMYTSTNPYEYALEKRISITIKAQQAVLLDVAHGKLILNF